MVTVDWFLATLVIIGLVIIGFFGGYYFGRNERAIE